jgi:hypothetical protein
MIIDCGAKGLEVAACAAAGATVSGVSRAGLSIDLRQFLATPKFVKPFNPSLDFELIAWLADIGQIDRQHVSAVDVLDILQAAFGLILLSDVVS